jgi:hypothetical protein
MMTKNKFSKTLGFGVTLLILLTKLMVEGATLMDSTNISKKSKNGTEMVFVFKKNISKEDAEAFIQKVGLPSHPGADASRGKIYFYSTGPKYIVIVPPAREHDIELLRFEPQIHEIYPADRTIQKD